MLECQLAGLVEQHVDDGSFRGCDDHRVDDLLTFTASAVAAYELHLGSGKRDVEDACVGGVGQVETDDLVLLCAQREIC